jgi:hypothetical protein
VSGPKLTYLDIECSTAESHHYGLFNQNLGISQIIVHPRIIGFARKEGDKKTVWFSEYHHGRQRMLEEFWHTLDRADYVIGWNSQGFDTKWIHGELIIDLPEWGPPSPYQNLDLMREWKGLSRTISNKLDYVSDRLLDARKIAENAMKLWIEIRVAQATGNAPLEKRLWTRMKKYCIQDVDLLPPILDRFRAWIKGLNYNNFQDDNGAAIVCAKCGGVDLQRRGVYRTAVSVFQVWRCLTCKGQTRSLKRESGASARG